MTATPEAEIALIYGLVTHALMDAVILVIHALMDAVILQPH